MSEEKDRKIWIVTVHITFSVYTNNKDEVLNLIGNTFKKEDPNVDIQNSFVISMEENEKTFNQIKKEEMMQKNEVYRSS